MIKNHAYYATQNSVSGSLKVGPVNVAVAESSVTGHYTTDNGALDVKDTEKKGSFSVTAGGKDYTIRGVRQSSEEVTPTKSNPGVPAVDKAPITRMLATVVIPVDVFEAVYKSRSLAEVPQEVISSMVGFMSKLDPKFATMSAEKMFGILNKGLNLAIEKNPKLMAAVLQGAKAQPNAEGVVLSSKMGVSFSLEYENYSKPPKWSFQLGLEGETQIKQNVPLGAVGYARIKAKADYEVGFKVQLPPDIIPAGLNIAADYLKK